MLVLQVCEARHEPRCYFDAMPALYCLKPFQPLGVKRTCQAA